MPVPTPPPTPPPTPQPTTTLEAFCGDIIGAGERRVLNGNLTCSGSAVAITVENGGDLDFKGYTISLLSSGQTGYGINMTGTGSKVSNCNVVGTFTNDNNYCIFMQGAFDDTSHTIVNSSVSGCNVGFYGYEGAVRIESSSAFDNSFRVVFGVVLSSTGTMTLLDVDASNNFYNIFIQIVTVEMTNVTACNSDYNDIYNYYGGNVSSSLLTCDQAKVYNVGANSITCDMPCP
jgi:hypothetical protein